ncbi:MAG TPA: fumarate hydratase [Alphaproteobacteria bacterium]|jgi:fumarate hydratase class I|nr:fumarate hydratase [Alphaproteobacteria bacterium]HBD52112.1 fumarate hydratase [Alphaproteobacteria bacterium]HBP72074.1 fumarate hydratase [Alphaproteobacteria bacterium]HCA15202.1 fumarate hydratase [Alphaproteobacteria bacterium]HCD79357.1 fumarate hydratase [Alphaproteobacteria bacterium]|tara:strand:- start:9887 stop:11506 length:1620 start_codon:yes stop_codon:yes gene_type:complete
MTDFAYSPMFPLAADDTEYELVSNEHVTLAELDGETFLKIDPEALRLLAARAFTDISHLLRSSHLAQLRAILDDPEATRNDRFVALEMLKNAVVAADGLLPMCQDTGTAIISGYRGDHVLVGGDEGEALSRGVFDTYQSNNLRYSQLTATSMFEEVNTATNLPAQIELYAGKGLEYKFAFIQKGGGSANKTFLHQKTKAVLNPEGLREFIRSAILDLGTSACPPYHLAIVIGGTSAEFNLKTVKQASIRSLDGLPTEGNSIGHAWRDVEWEAEILQITRDLGIGAQFGGKYYCHDVRVIRLPRHGASCPIGIGVSCSADRQALAKITPDGIFIEKLERDPARFLPDAGSTDSDADDTAVVEIDLNQPMAQILETLSQHPVETRLSLTGPLIVARDIAHAKLLERLEAEGALPDYFKDHPVYYAGPAKTPDGMASGSFGPTTAGRMDSYVPTFQAAGGSMVMLAKGNRSRQVRESCKTNGGFYLGSIGGVAAKLALESIRKVEVLEYPELGMEAVWKIEVENFPAFIITDDKGNDFFDIG